MASGLQNQYQASQDQSFQQKVTEAICAAAISIYNEAVTSTAYLRAGTVSANIPLSSALPTAIAANTTIRLGSELLMCVAGAAQNATTIPVATTTSVDHFAGEAVSPPSQTNHQVRANYARVVLGAPAQVSTAWAEGLASQGIDTSSPDGSINASVSALWNGFAGA